MGIHVHTLISRKKDNNFWLLGDNERIRVVLTSNKQTKSPRHGQMLDDNDNHQQLRFTTSRKSPTGKVQIQSI